jgi:hypothetical protein
MRTNELSLAKARQASLRAEVADRRLAATWHATTGRTGLAQVWTTVRATLTAPSIDTSLSR